MSFAAGQFELKIDGVTSAADALALQEAGATIIGIDPTPSAPPPGPVSRRAGLEIREALTHARLAVRLDQAAGSIEAALTAARVFEPQLLQVSRHVLDWTSWRQALGAEGLPVFIDNIAISYEDDPAFIESRLAAMTKWAGATGQVAFLADMGNPWSFLLNEAPNEPDGYVQMEQLGELVRTYPMLISMQIQASEAQAFLNSFAAAKGLFFEIDEDGVRPVLEIIRACQVAAPHLRQASKP